MTTLPTVPPIARAGGGYQADPAAQAAMRSPRPAGHGPVRACDWTEPPAERGRGWRALRLDHPAGLGGAWGHADAGLWHDRDQPGLHLLGPGRCAAQAGSTGKPLMHTEARIVNDAGGDCGPDEIGELWVAGPNITPGYWNRPDATASALVGRWLKTGDAARQDSEGFYYIVDRWKDIYISGGENVYPAEVENVIYQLPQVAEAAVIGVPSDTWGEVGLAVLVLKPGQQLDLSAVLAHCTGRMARFKQPHDIAVLPELPRNATGKVRKRELRKQFVGQHTPVISQILPIPSTWTSPP